MVLAVHLQFSLKTDKVLRTHMHYHIEAMTVFLFLFVCLKGEFCRFYTSVFVWVLQNTTAYVRNVVLGLLWLQRELCWLELNTTGLKEKKKKLWGCVVRKK